MMPADMRACNIWRHTGSALRRKKRSQKKKITGSTHTHTHTHIPHTMYNSCHARIAWITTLSTFVFYLCACILCFSTFFAFPLWTFSASSPLVPNLFYQFYLFPAFSPHYPRPFLQLGLALPPLLLAYASVYLHLSAY